MESFLFLGGLVLSVFTAAYGTAFLISLGINEVLCYLLYLVALMVISWIAHFVNSKVFGWYDDTYKPLADSMTYTDP